MVRLDYCERALRRRDCMCPIVCVCQPVGGARLVCAWLPKRASTRAYSRVVSRTNHRACLWEFRHIRYSGETLRSRCLSVGRRRFDIGRPVPRASSLCQSTHRRRARFLPSACGTNSQCHACVDTACVDTVRAKQFIKPPGRKGVRRRHNQVVPGEWPFL